MSSTTSELVNFASDYKVRRTKNAAGEGLQHVRLDVGIGSTESVITSANPLPTSVASLPLPSGAATESTLSALSAKVTACNTGAVTVSSSALPSGASTSALQTSGNASLTSIDGKITACNTASISGSVSIVTGAVAATVEARTQTPTGNALNVQIGPGDPISNIPVFIDFGQHQVHEGEAFISQYVDTSLDTNTIKFQLTVGAYAVAIQAPHLRLSVDIYNGAARYDLYEGGTSISGGSSMTVYNRHRNIAVPASVMTIKQAVTATGTTLLESQFVGSGTRGSAGGGSNDEWVLKPSTTYIVYLTGLAAGTDAILHFEWYEDLGV